MGEFFARRSGWQITPVEGIIGQGVWDGQKEAEATISNVRTAICLFH